MRWREIAEAVVADDEARPVRPRAGRPRRKPREVTWEELTDYQRKIVEAGQTVAVVIPAEMTDEQYVAWTMERIRKA
jgi:hypothetical protein